MNYAIETVDLTKHFFVRGHSEKKVIVANDHINLKVRKGEIYGIIGPNGAGKTTLINLVSGMLKPTYGTVYVLGYDIREVKYRINNICLASFSGVQKSFTGGIGRVPAVKALKYMAGMYGVEGNLDEKAKEALRLVDLDKWMNNWPVQFSSGMLRRLELALLIMLDKPVLCLDEPTIYLDPLHAKEFRDLLRNLAKGNNYTVLLTTQYMDEVKYTCDKVAFLKDGRIVFTGTPEDMKKVIPSQKVFEFIVSKHDTESLQDKIMRLDKVLRVRSRVEGERIHIIVEVSGEIDEKGVEEVFSSIVDILARMVKIYNIRIREPDLNEAFIALAGVKK